MVIKKNVLRTSVIASVMSMAFTASVWANGIDVNGYGEDEVKSATSSLTGVMYDYGWYSPDGNFYYSDQNGKIKSVPATGTLDEKIAAAVAGVKANGDYSYLQSKGLDHNGGYDSISNSNEAVDTYVEYMSKNGFTAQSVAQLLSDNLKFNYDTASTLIEHEEYGRKQTDKYLNDHDVNSISHSLNANGVLTTTIGFNGVDSITATADISGYVGDKIKNEAGDAWYDSSNSITLNQAITNNATNISNNTSEINKIRNNYVTNISKEETSDDRDIWNVTQNIDGTSTTIQITDEHINAYTMAINGDNLDSKITTNFGTEYKNSVRIGDATINYAGDNNQAGDIQENKSTIEQAINNNYTKIVNVENNNVSYISERTEGTEVINNKTYNVEYYEVTQKVNGEDIPVQIKDTTLVEKRMFDGHNPGWIDGYSDNNAIAYKFDEETGVPQVFVEFEDTSGNVVQGAIDFGTLFAGSIQLTGDENIVVTAGETGNGNWLENSMFSLNDDIAIVSSLTVANTVNINEGGINMGGQKITNLAPGEVSATSTDAINGSQLYQTKQDITKLGGRLDKVGAGAAALAALHPLDFDPDDKLSFSAGVGNYGGETATAIGAFYRPTEKVMLSAAGTMGNGENMVNMGVTFALDRKNNVSNSRVAMAREIQDLRAQVAQLTALVTQIAGRNNPALQDTVMFPDVPENHWAYDYIESLQKRGIIEGYPDGNYGGDRSCTRYEYAAMLYRALEKGFPVDSRLLDEFDAELGRIRVDRIKGEDADANKIERVRVNDYEDRDDYGSKIIAVAAPAAQ